MNVTCTEHELLFNQKVDQIWRCWYDCYESIWWQLKTKIHGTISVWNRNNIHKGPKYVAPHATYGQCNRIFFSNWPLIRLNSYSSFCNSRKLYQLIGIIVLFNTHAGLSTVLNFSPSKPLFIVCIFVRRERQTDRQECLCEGGWVWVDVILSLH